MFTAPADAAPDGRALYDEYQAVDAALRATAAALREVEAALAARIATPIAPEGPALEARADELAALERRRDALRAEGARLETRLVLLGDALLPHRQQARLARQEQLRAALEALEQRDHARRVAITDHLQAIDRLEAEGRALALEIERLAGELARHALRTDRLVRVSVHTTSPLRPPADVLVRPSAWRRVVEAARAVGLDTFELIVNEHTGTIARAPVPLLEEDHP